MYFLCVFLFNNINFTNKKMSVKFTTEERGNKRGDFLIRLSWQCHYERLQTTVGLTTISGVSGNRVCVGHKKNSKNITPEEINAILEKIENFLYDCEAYALEKGVKLQRGTMRGLFKDYKSMNYTCEQEIMDRWITSTPSNGIYWHKYDGGFYKKLCEATDSSDSSKRYVIYQEVFGHSRIFSISLDDFYGIVEFNGTMVKRFIEVSADIALEENAEWKEIHYIKELDHSIPFGWEM